MKASLHEPIVIVVHEGLVPEHPTPCPEEPAIVAEAAPAWFEPPPAWFEPPLPAKLVCPPLLAPPPFMGSLLVDAHE